MTRPPRIGARVRVTDDGGMTDPIARIGDTGRVTDVTRAGRDAVTRERTPARVWVRLDRHHAAGRPWSIEFQPSELEGE